MASLTAPSRWLPPKRMRRIDHTSLETALFFQGLCAGGVRHMKRLLICVRRCCWRLRAAGAENGHCGARRTAPMSRPIAAAGNRMEALTRSGRRAGAPPIAPGACNRRAIQRACVTQRRRATIAVAARRGSRGCVAATSSASGATTRARSVGLVRRGQPDVFRRRRRRARACALFEVAPGREAVQAARACPYSGESS